MRYAPAFFALLFIALAGCDSKSTPAGAEKRLTVKVSDSDSFYAKTANDDFFYITGAAGVPISHSLEDFICLQRLGQAEQTMKTINLLDRHVKGLDIDSPHAASLRKEISENRTQLLKILSDLENAQIIVTP